MVSWIWYSFLAHVEIRLFNNFGKLPKQISSPSRMVEYVCPPTPSSFIEFPTTQLILCLGTIIWGRDVTSFDASEDSTQKHDPHTLPEPKRKEEITK